MRFVHLLPFLMTSMVDYSSKHQGYLGIRKKFKSKVGYKRKMQEHLFTLSLTSNSYSGFI